MTTDLYTKAVLTIIALALSAIALQHTIPSAFAQSGVQKVIICDALTPSFCADVSTGGALKVQSR
jgi:hypothetical protein